MQRCNAITAKVTNCTNSSIEDGLCRVHMKSRMNTGPNAFELDQLKLKHRKERAELFAEMVNQQALSRVVGRNDEGEIYDKYRGDCNVMRTRHTMEINAVRVRQQADIAAAGGVDPDAEAKERKRQRNQRRIARQNENRERIREQRIHIRLAQIAQQEEDFANDHHEVVLFAQAHPPIRELRHIAADPQSIHTTEAVRHTKEIVARVRKVAVPEGYRWDKEVCSKTPGEIITECKLSQKAAWQMMSQYAQDTAIYDIEEGIYGKVLDCVWEFVKTHAEKDSLTAILRSELQDNIGMCAQGNLTRICNILSGYLDGVGVMETLSEKLGRLLPPLREIEDLDERYDRLMTILHDNEVPEEDIPDWLDAVMDD